MFTGFDGLGGTKRLFNAYISQSTRSLRALLKEHVSDVPLSVFSAQYGLFLGAIESVN